MGTNRINQEEFFQAGGGLHAKSPSYVERDADSTLYDALKKGEFCYVLTARQMGKTSLKNRITNRLRNEGCLVVNIDLSAFGNLLTFEQWYGGLAYRLGEQTNLKNEIDSHFISHSQLGPLQRWMTAITEVVLCHCQGEVIIFIDEIDSVRTLPFNTDEFFAGIRELYNRRSDDPRLYGLTFGLIGVASPADLVQDGKMTPFNIGRMITLSDFSLVEAMHLAPGLEIAGYQKTDSVEILNRIFYWTNGQPFMTQSLCAAIVKKAIKISYTKTCTTLVDDACEALFLKPGARETNSNLSFVHQFLLSNQYDLPGMLQCYQKARQGVLFRDSDSNPLTEYLKLSGILAVATHKPPFWKLQWSRFYHGSDAYRTRSGVLAVKNRIYAAVFDKEWINEAMPGAELRRQKKAFRKGLAYALSLSGIVASIIGGLAFYAFSQANVAREETRRGDIVAEKNRDLAVQKEAALRTSLLQQALAERRAKQAIDNLELANKRLVEANVARTEARNATEDALQKALIADANAAEALHQQAIATRTAYFADMSLIQDEFDSGNSIRVQKLLKLTSAGQFDKYRGFEWGYWNRLLNRDTLLIDSGSRSALGLAWSPDGRKIVSVGHHGDATIWDAITGMKVRKLLGLRGGSCIAWSPDGRRILAGSEFAKARMWDADSGRQLIEVSIPHKKVICVAFSPDSKKFATGSEANTANVWSASTGMEFSTLQGHSQPINGIAFSGDGSRLATCCADGIAFLWSAASGKMTRAYLGNKKPMVSIAFSHDSNRIVTGLKDGNAIEWDAKSCDVLHSIPISASANAVEYSPNDKSILFSDAGVAKIWDTNSLKFSKTFRGHASEVTSATYSPDGSRVASASQDGMVKIWSSVPQEDSITLRSDRMGFAIRTTGFSPDGTRIFTGSEDATATVWDSEGKEISALKGHKQPLLAASFSNNGERMITASIDNSVKVWNSRTGAELFAIQLKNRLLHAAISSGEITFLVTANEDRIIRIWDLESGRLLKSSPVFPSLMNRMACSANGKLLLACFDDSTIRLIDAKTMNSLKLLKNEFAKIDCIAFSPDSKLFMTGYENGIAILRRVATGLEVLRLEGHPGAIYDIAFSPDGKRVVTVSLDKTAKLWDVETGSLALTLKSVDSSPVSAVSFSPDGSRILTGNDDGNAKIWISKIDSSTRVRNDLTKASSRAERLDKKRAEYAKIMQQISTECESGNPIRMVQLLKETNSNEFKRFQGFEWGYWNRFCHQELMTFKAHSDVVNSATYSPDGKFILTNSNDTTAKVWDASNYKLILTLRGHTGKIHSAAYKHDGNRIITAGGDRTIRLWDAKTGNELLKFSASTDVIKIAIPSPDGKLIALGDVDSNVSVWDAITGEPIETLATLKSKITDLSFSPDGKNLAVSSDSPIASVWSLGSRTKLFDLKGHKDRINSIAYSHDGKRIVTGSWDGAVKVWDAFSGVQILSFQAHSKSVWSATFSPDGTKIATSSADNTAKIFDASSGRELITFRGHSNDVNSITFSSDGKSVLTASDDSTVKLWRVDKIDEIDRPAIPARTPTVLQTIIQTADMRLRASLNDGNSAVLERLSGGKKTRTILRGSGKKLCAMAFSQDGSRIASCSEDGTIDIWETEAGSRMLSINSKIGKLSSIEFSPDGERLTVFSNNGTSQSWHSKR